MTVIDHLARPRIVIAGQLGDFALRGLTHGLRLRLPMARVGTMSRADVDGLAAGDVVDAVVQAEVGSASVDQLAGWVVELRPKDIAHAPKLCTSALPDDLRDRRLALMRRLRWLPDRPAAVVADPGAQAAAALREAHAQGLDADAIVVVDFGDLPPAPAFELAGVRIATVPPEAGVDDIAAVVVAAKVCVGVHPALVALATGCGVPVVADSAGVIAALRDDGTCGPAPRHLEMPALDECLDRATAIAFRRWEGRAGRDDAAHRRAAARAGAAHASHELEVAHLTLQLADTGIRLDEAQAALAAVHHSRTWRYRSAVRAVIARARPFRSGPG